MEIAYLILNHAMGSAISSNAHMSHTIASLVPHRFVSVGIGKSNTHTLAETM